MNVSMMDECPVLVEGEGVLMMFVLICEKGQSGLASAIYKF